PHTHTHAQTHTHTHTLTLISVCWSQLALSGLLPCLTGQDQSPICHWGGVHPHTHIYTHTHTHTHGGPGGYVGPEERLLCPYETDRGGVCVCVCVCVCLCV